jgi:hypothetical protein
MAHQQGTSDFFGSTGAGTSADPILPQVTAPSDVIAITPTLDTNIYASGDLLADATAIVAARVTGGRAIIQSLSIVDIDNQGAAFSIYIMSTSTTWGTLNAAPSITAANIAAGFLGRIDVATGDYTTVNSTKIASLKNLGIMIEATVATVYAVLVNGTGTPTYTASGLKLGFGLLQH